MMRTFLMVCVVLMLMGGSALAFDVVQVPTGHLMVTWQEPTLNNVGGALTDLAKIVLVLTVDGVARAEEEAAVSGPTGGQPGFHTFLDVCEPDSMPEVEVDVRPVDNVGNRASGVIGIMAMDCVAPGPVQ